MKLTLCTLISPIAGVTPPITQTTNVMTMCILLAVSTDLGTVQSIPTFIAC